nr:mannose-1-phosphate guanylyltransferase [Propionibacterium sp.]
MRYVVIMAGGSGTRLWPLSRKGTPKQLLKIVAGRSLLRLAFERAALVVPPSRIVVVTGAAYLGAVAADLPEVPSENLLGEPEGRDSLNACAWPAAVLHARDPEAVIAQVTADQLIEPADTFADVLREAFAVAEEERDVLVTLGVVPTGPHTGYGYLQRGEPLPGRPAACHVASFTEKPDLATATAYVASGGYWWNAGLFVWRAATFLEQVRILEPATYADVLLLAAEPERLGAIFPTLKRNSVDYAIMEPVAHGKGTARVVAVPLPVRWRDVGGFENLAEILPTDAAGNAGQGRVVALAAERNIVFDQTGPGRLVALLGVSDLIVVETADATLVAHQDQAEQIKALVGLLAESAPEYV